MWNVGLGSRPSVSPLSPSHNSHHPKANSAVDLLDKFLFLQGANIKLAVVALVGMRLLINQGSMLPTLKNTTSSNLLPNLCRKLELEV